MPSMGDVQTLQGEQSEEEALSAPYFFNLETVVHHICQVIWE